MPQYNSHRHRKLMGESEYALHYASDSSSLRESRIVNTLLQDKRIYKLWESRHADLLLPVAEYGDRSHQVKALRDAEVRLVHRRALFRYLRENEVRGKQRRQLFRILHSNLDYHDAVLTEHRQYMLAVSSRISTDHLIDVMRDPKSKSLPRKYERLYTRYFEMQCYVMGMGDSKCFELVLSAMGDARDQLRRQRRHIESVPPDSECDSFDRQESLARSGRYPVLDYMVG